LTGQIPAGTIPRPRNQQWRWIRQQCAQLVVRTARLFQLAGSFSGLFPSHFEVTLEIVPRWLLLNARRRDTVVRGVRHGGGFWTAVLGNRPLVTLGGVVHLQLWQQFPLRLVFDAEGRCTGRSRIGLFSVKIYANQHTDRVYSRFRSFAD